MSRRGGAGRLHGYLVVDKPACWTSHDVVNRVRRLTGERKVGHAGTLDPAATGVLPVAVGVATRSLEYLAESSKTYLAEITLGVATDSYDADGIVVDNSSVPPLHTDAIAEVLASFLGVQRQVPPMHSAIRVGGKRLYELARRGESIDRDARVVQFHELRLVSWNSPVLTCCVDCSKGTYIRTLAHDIGLRIGCGAHLSNLVRLRTGSFSLTDAWTLGELESIDLISEWETVALHPDAGCDSLDAIVIDLTDAVAWRQGKQLPAAVDTEAFVRVYDAEGEWLGIARGSGDGHWQPSKVVGSAA